MSLSEPGEPRVPLDVERQPPPQLGPEKGALDLGLLSQESETTVRAWLQGPRGVCVPTLRSPLPYQPPALGNLRVLSCLLLRKQALERRAAALEPLPGQLQRSPAYLLLKARFVAAFALPALLATLPPPGVLTTLSAAARASSESEDSDLGERERSDGHRQPVEVGGPLPAPLRLPLPGCGCEACPELQGRGLGREPVEVAAAALRAGGLWGGGSWLPAAGQWRVDRACAWRRRLPALFSQCGPLEEEPSHAGDSSWGDPWPLLGLLAWPPSLV